MDEIAEDALILGIVALGAYVAYKQLFASPLSDANGATALQSAGLKVIPTTKGNTGTYAQSGNTTYHFLPGDFSQLNFAQRILIGVDKVVPGHFLTDWALS